MINTTMRQMGLGMCHEFGEEKMYIYDYKLCCSECKATANGLVKVRNPRDELRLRKTVNELIRENLVCNCGQMFHIKFIYMFDEYLIEGME